MDSSVEPRVIELTIGGMTCGGCVRSVEKTLSRVPGVSAASVDLAAGKATIQYDGSRAKPEDLISAVGRTGFEASHSPANEAH